MGDAPHQIAIVRMSDVHLSHYLDRLQTSSFYLFSRRVWLNLRLLHAFLARGGLCRWWGDGPHRIKKILRSLQQRGCSSQRREQCLMSVSIINASTTYQSDRPNPQISNHASHQEPHFFASGLHHQLSHHVTFDLPTLLPLDSAEAQQPRIHVTDK